MSKNETNHSQSQTHTRKYTPPTPYWHLRLWDFALTEIVKYYHSFQDAVCNLALVEAPIKLENIRIYTNQRVASRHFSRNKSIVESLKLFLYIFLGQQYITIGVGAALW